MSFKWINVTNGTVVGGLIGYHYPLWTWQFWALLGGYLSIMFIASFRDAYNEWKAHELAKGPYGRLYNDK